MTNITPMKAIRAKCIDCSCGEKKEVRLCPIEWCPLWPYRMGKRPAKDAKSIRKNENKKIEIASRFSEKTPSEIAVLKRGVKS